MGVMKLNDFYVCNAKLKLAIRDNLDKFQARPQVKEGVQQAAVALTIVDVAHGSDAYALPCYKTRRSDAALILTRRNTNLRNHSGQWALPGGRRDAGETAAETALRELAEEVGLSLSADRVMGCLDDFTTRSGFVITPVVIWGGAGVDLTPNPAEVASIHRIPLTEFLREDAPLIQNIPESSAPVILMPVGNTCIAAPTAAILYQFREVAIQGKNTRVAHYEQPVFAWK